MCGIFCCFSHTAGPHTCIHNSNLMQLLKNRGPNSMEVKHSGNAIFGGFVLWHQGYEMCTQPVESDSYLLLYNGDIFNKNSFESQDISDSKWLFDQLSMAAAENKIISCFKNIEGPYSILFYDKKNKILYFARDSLGRNSLLIENNTNHFRLISTSYNDGIENNIMELPPLGIYKLCTNEFQNCNLFPWRTMDADCYEHLDKLEKICNIRINIVQQIEHHWSTYELKNKKYEFNFYDMISTPYSTVMELYDNLLRNDDILKAVKEFSELLQDSVKKRVQYTINCCAFCLEQKISCSHSKVAILFSGGIDCSILAVLADKFVSKADTIDLVNVAFESGMDGSWNVPDRLSAKASLQNLKDICPERKWNFIEVNVGKEELHANLKAHVKHLIYPLNTVLDESIGCAFWFAARAEGLKDNKNWKSSARVIILGSGADELFGGYMRHKNAYIRYNGTEEQKQGNLHRELEKDWNRIPSRNLARDDRVISDSGKTARAPFIEERVVRFVRSLLSNQRCCFLLGDGVGDKLFLRLYGYYLGLKGPIFLKKRAIQFGSKIANKKQNAADRSIYL